jgi:hypothetical protein
MRRKIRLIEGNAKGRQLKELTCKGTLRQRQVFICVRPKTTKITYPPVYVYAGKRGRGRELNQREG